ncbi:helix-turn-helix domain-containing protein [Peribacillus asahii]|uniref:helix-turn-helix domain-containing protein n=1 Tax=Peribacillus asahii TaxID=228899 RepID=UPI00207A27A6|nr:helix-turn-helix domain-containing protein [Peribacillus asahii]USK71733.1 helix-turn-helix domain-containing protein [Peribacillus asahii]
MSNNLNRVVLYSPSQIGEILKIARERACQEERRTKRFVSEGLGITVQRLTNIEEGFSNPPFELAVDWCQLVEDYTALEKIKHIYQMGLPATDPRLLESVPNQLINLIQQATGAIGAAESLLQISKDMRPGKPISERTSSDMLHLAEEILDLKQAVEATLSSMRKNWGLDIEQVTKNWIQEALADQVIISSVSHFEDIRKEQYFEERARLFGRGKH